MSRMLGLRSWVLAKLRMVFTISFFVMFFSHFHFCRVLWVLVGLEIRFTAKTKVTSFLRWLEFKRVVRSRFRGGYPNDSSLDTKANGQRLRANGCSAPPYLYMHSIPHSRDMFFNI